MPDWLLWLLPVPVATLAAVAWAAWTGRVRGPAGPVEAVEAHERFRRALAPPERPPRASGAPLPVPMEDSQGTGEASPAPSGSRRTRRP